MNANAKNKGQYAKLKLIMIFLVALGPLVLAYIMLKTGFLMPEGKNNHGILFDPVVDMSAVKFTDLAGDPFDLLSEKKWSLLLINDPENAEITEKQIYLINQVHTALGREQTRVTPRFLVLTPEKNQPIIDYTQKQFPKIQLISTKDNDFFQGIYHLLTQNAEMPISPLILVIDPLGNTVLAYTTKHNGKDMLDDLKRLLKYSKIG